MGTPTSGYVYIATCKGLTQSYVDVAPSLLDMDWIAKFGVNDLVWFEGYSDVARAQARADELRSMSEDQRRSFVLSGNPTLTDLTARIWGSDKEEG